MADLFARWRRKPAREGLVGLEICRDGFALVHRLGTTAEPRIAACEFRPCADIADPSALREALAGAVRDHGLQGARCVAVLPPQRYGLRLLDAPDVEPEELAGAVPWLVKDLVDFPLDEAVVDYFEVPERPGGQSRLHVVTVHRSVVDDLVEAVEEAGLKLAVVDVCELALRNLAARLPEEEQGLALLRLERGGGVLTMNRGGNLYLARSIETGIDALRQGPAPDPLAGHGPDAFEPDSLGIESLETLETPEMQTNEAFDLLALEIQRSLDYYESQLGPSPIAQLAVAPLAAPVAGLLPFLEKSLSTGVRRLDLEDLGLSIDGVRGEEQSRCFTAVGAALRCGPEDETGA